MNVEQGCIALLLQCSFLITEVLSKHRCLFFTFTANHMFNFLDMYDVFFILD